MGACYSVSLIGLKFKDEQGAKKALQDKIARGEEEHTNYEIPHFEALGKSTDKLEDLLAIFFAGWDAKLDHINWEGREWLTAGFNAGYGWEGVMMDAFEDIAPFLEDGSEVQIYPDSGCDHGVVKDGKVEWVS